MKKIYLLIITLVLCSCNGNFFNKESAYQRYEKSFLGAFDTYFTIIMYEENEDFFLKNCETIQETFNYYHCLFDRYNNYDGINNLKTINDYAGISPVVVPDELFNLIKFSIDCNKNISNKVDITLGPIIDKWNYYRDLNNGEVPNQDELVDLSAFVNIDKISLDEKNRSIFVEEKGMKLDVGAIAKGYACELVKTKLIEMGINNFCISAGGNVISYGEKVYSNSNSALAKALSKSKQYYTVSIKKPTLREQVSTDEYIAAIVLDEGQSVVTSGNYERYFIGNDGNVYHHLIDPYTLYPARYLKSVTVITQDSGFADFLSSALYLTDIDNGLRIVNSMDFELEVIWVTNDDEVIYTSGLKEGEDFILY